MAAKNLTSYTRDIPSFWRLVSLRFPLLLSSSSSSLSTSSCITNSAASQLGFLLIPTLGVPPVLQEMGEAPRVLLSSRPGTEQVVVLMEVQPWFWQTLATMSAMSGASAYMLIRFSRCSSVLGFWNNGCCKEIHSSSFNGFKRY